MPPDASSCLSTPLTNATSPPVCTGKNSSVIFVPNTALSTLDGTQYRSSPGSRSGLTTAIFAPRFLARNRYFMKTGWPLATSEPNRTTRSLSITSRYEQVVAATPIAAFNAVVDGAWQTRAALSTLFVPIAARGLLRDVVHLVGDPTRGEVDADAVGSRRADPAGDEVERVVPRHAREATLPRMPHHRVREPSEARAAHARSAAAARRRRTAVPGRSRPRC